MSHIKIINTTFWSGFEIICSHCRKTIKENKLEIRDGKIMCPMCQTSL